VHLPAIRQRTPQLHRHAVRAVRGQGGAGGGAAREHADAGAAHAATADARERQVLPDDPQAGKHLPQGGAPRTGVDRTTQQATNEIEEPSSRIVVRRRS